MRCYGDASVFTALSPLVYYCDRTCNMQAAAASCNEYANEPATTLQDLHKSGSSVVVIFMAVVIGFVANF